VRVRTVSVAVEAVPKYCSGGFGRDFSPITSV
jgi:hypothetical protein